MPIDLASTLLIPSYKRYVSFLSIAIGMMVDLDIGTESLRWMGDTRFVLGFLKGVALSKTFQCRVHLDVRESDKVEMARKARERVKVPIMYGDEGDRAVEGVREMLGDIQLGDPEEAVAGVSNAADGQADGADESDDIGQSSTSKHVPPASGTDEASGPLDESKKLEKGPGWLTILSGTAKDGAYPKPHTENAIPPPDGGWPEGQGLMYL